MFRRTIFPIPLNFIDVERETNTSLDVPQEATIDDCWNMDGDESLSEPWIGVTRFPLLSKNPPERYTWIQGRLTKNQVTTTPRNVWPEKMVKYVKWFTSVMPQINWRRNTTIGRCERTARHLFHSGRLS